MGELTPARDELLALACATRTDWTERDVEAAVVRAQLAGWTWARILTAVVLLAADPLGVPDELAPAVRSGPPADPDNVHRIVAAAKRDIQGRRPKEVDT